MPQLEKGAKNENNYTTISYCFPNNEYEELSAMSKDAKKELTTKVKWVAFKHQFFSSILVAKNDFVNADLSFQKLNEDGPELKDLTARMSLPLQDGKNETIGFNFYFGPNHFKTLKSYNLGFEQNISYYICNNNIIFFSCIIGRTFPKFGNFYTV